MAMVAMALTHALHLTKAVPLRNVARLIAAALLCHRQISVPVEESTPHLSRPQVLVLALHFAAPALVVLPVEVIVVVELVRLQFHLPLPCCTALATLISRLAATWTAPLMVMV